ncbi:MAG TPA: DUF11 domain-containing protein, partial [Rhodothermales bacterium]|nr:DUF11 domain-containing protein [Rhodothermales bacterium]
MVTYNITVTNHGPNPATTVSVMDLLPAGLTLRQANATQGSYASGVWAVGVLPVGQSAVLQLAAQVDQAAQITNTALVANPSEPDPVSANNTSSATINATRGADVALYKTVDKLAPNTGERVTFTLTARNFGPNTASAVSVTDLLPAGLTFVSSSATRGTYAAATGLWSIGVLASGQSETLNIVANVTNNGVIVNSATISNTPEPDPQTANNATTATINAATAADLALAKTVDNLAPKSGDTITYTVTLRNNGPNNATGIIVADLVPNGLTLIQASPSQGTYTAASGTWTVGAVANGQTVTLQLAARVDNTGSIVNTASVTASDQPDPIASNNTSAASINGSIRADVQVSKTIDKATPIVGETVVYTVTVRNNGPNNATGLAVTDQLPAGLTLQNATTSQGTFASGTGIWTIGTLPVGQSVTLTLSARVDASGSITNTASVTAQTEPDPVANNNTSNAIITSGIRADVSVRKTVSNLSPKLDDIVTFTVQVSNYGPSPATTVLVNDTLPAGLTLQQSSVTQGSYDAATGRWSIGNMPSGQTVVMMMTARVTATGPLSNTATVSAMETDPVTTNNSSTAMINGTNTADVAVAKWVDNLTPKVDDIVNYTVRVTNYGPNIATNVRLTDVLPTGMALVTHATTQGAFAPATGLWTIGTIPVNQSVTMNLAIRISAAGTFTNTVTVTANETDPQTGNNTSVSVLNASRAADVAVYKTSDKLTPNVGEKVTFTVTVRNFGPNIANNVSVTDLFPASMQPVVATTTRGSYAGGIWTIGQLGIGQAEVMQVVGTVAASGTIINTAIVSADEADPIPSNNSSYATLNASIAADLEVIKSVSNLTPKVGDVVTFTVNLRNYGPNTATLVNLNDVLPAGLTLQQTSVTQGSMTNGNWAVGTILAGRSATLQIAARVDATGAITNVASVSANEFDPISANNVSQATINGTRTADLVMTKMVDNLVPKQNDIVTWTLTVQNLGPNVATGVNVFDLIPTASLALVQASPSQGTFNAGAWNVGTLAVGQTAVMQLATRITSVGPITNTAVASATEADPITGNNTSAATLNATVAADMAVVKTVDNLTPKTGDTINYTVRVTNHGPNIANQVIATDLIPAGLTYLQANTTQGTYTAGNGQWSIGTLAVGQSATLQIAARVDNTGTITNNATVTASEPDPLNANNASSATVNATKAADIGVTKTVSNLVPKTDDVISFTVTVRNNGPNPATNVQVNDTLPAGLSLIQTSATQGAYASNTGVWTIGALPVGQIAVMNIAAKVTNTGTIVNTAIASATETDPVTANNTSQATINANRATDLAVYNTVDNLAPNTGDRVTYTVLARNNGPNDATNVAVADLLPAGLTFVSATSTRGQYQNGQWTIGALAAGQAETLLITTTVGQTGAITTTAIISGTEPDPIPANNTSVATIRSVTSADLEIRKTVDALAPKMGDRVTFTIALKNNGPNDATNVTVADAIPAGMTFVNASASRGTYSAATGVWSVGSVPNGQSVLLQIIATVNTVGPITNTATATATEPDPISANNVSSATVNVSLAVDVAVVKTVDNLTPKTGDTIHYTVTVWNHGPNTATGIAVTDVIPTGMTLLNTSTSQGTYNTGNSQWGVGTLAVGQAAQMVIALRVENTGLVTNTATVISTEPDPILANNSSSATINATRAADLAVTKTVDNLVPKTGDNITYTVVVTNHGPNVATNVSIADNVPAGTTLVQSSATQGTFNTNVWTVGTIPVGQSALLRYVATVTTTGTVMNTAVVSGTEPDPQTANNTSVVTINAIKAADVGLAKTVDNLTPKTGDTVHFTVTVRNYGPNVATNVAVDDVLPAGITLLQGNATQGIYTAGNWNIGTLAVGQGAVLQLAVKVDNIGRITNTATVSATETDPITANNTSSATINGTQTADLAVYKTLDKLAPRTGEQISFTVLVTNHGPNNATAVAVDDVLPAGLTFQNASATRGAYATGVWTIGNLPVGQSETLTLTALVNNTGAITNTAIVAATQPDPIPSNNTSSAIVNASTAADVAVVKTVDQAAPKAGDTVNFTVKVTNYGPNTANNVAAQDLLPSGLTLVQSNATQGTYAGATGVWNIGTLAVGQSSTLTLTVKVEGEGIFTNRATVTATETDPIPANNTSSATVNASQTADVAVRKTVDQLAPKTGDVVNFTVVATNYGPNAASGVQVTDVVPSGLTLVQANTSVGTYTPANGKWTIGPLAAGQSVVMNIAARVEQTGIITNTATITALESDPVPSNNTSSASVNASQAADMAVLKTVDKVDPKAGDVVYFTITAQNHGPNNATSVVVTDALPAGLSLVQASPSQGTYVAGTGAWSIGSVAAGQSVVMTIAARVDNTGAIVNTATITATEPDPQIANNISAATVNATRAADVVVVKTADNLAPKTDDLVTYSVVIRNYGPNPATNVSVADNVPAGTTLVQASATQGTYATGTWTIGSIAVGQGAIMQMVVRVNNTGVIPNTAVVSATETDPVPANNTSTATLNASRAADIAVRKTVSNLAPKVSDLVTFNVTVTNHGPNPATNVVVVDAVPAGLTLVQSAATQGAYTGGNWTVGALPVGQSATLQMTVRVDNEGAITNTANASATEPDPQAANNVSVATLNASRAADMAVQKTVDNLAPKEGDLITYTVLVRNYGPNTATNVSVADNVPAGVTLVQASATQGAFNANVWTIGTMEVGQSALLNITVRVGTTGAIQNTAVVSATERDPQIANNTSVAWVNASKAADVAITKTADVYAPKTGDLVNYTVTVRNYGPNPATTVSVTDLLPAGISLVQHNTTQGAYDTATGKWTIGTLPVGQAVTMNLTVRINNTGRMTNTATVTATELDPQTANNESSATINASQAADVAVEKTVDRLAVRTAESVTFRVKVTNYGPNPATNVKVDDVVPTGMTLLQSNTSQGTYAAGEWNIGNLPVGQSVVLEMTMRVEQDGRFTNTAIVSATQFDPELANNTSSSAVNVSTAADLRVAATANNLAPKVGDVVTFSVTVQNFGPNHASGVNVSNPIPTGTSLIKASATQGTFNPATGTWNIGTLPSGQIVLLQLAVTVNTTGMLMNNAVVSASEPDPIMVNNESSAALNASQAADVAVRKQVDNLVPKVGDIVNFTVTAQNFGPNAASAVTVADVIPAGVTLVQANTTAGTYGGGTWNIGALPVGQSVVLQIAARVTSTGETTNTATISATELDPVLNNNTSAATINATQAADVTVTKSVDKLDPKVGDRVAFTVTVKNNGPNTATNVSVADPIPSGMSLYQANAGQGTYAAGVWNIGTLPVGQSTTLTIAATVTATGQITNTAIVSATEPDPVLVNNTSVASVNAFQAADVAVVKTTDNAVPNEGDRVTFSVKVTNYGPNTATAVSVADVLPAGLRLDQANATQGAYNAGTWAVGTLPVGQSATLSMTTTVLNKGTIVNLATVSATEQDPIAVNNTSTATLNAASNADLELKKTANTLAPKVGDVVTFTLTLRNNGPVASAGVKVSDVLPAGLSFVSAAPAAEYDTATGEWNIGAVPVGQTRTLQIATRVNTAGPITNTATITAGTPTDPVASNNSSAVTLNADNTVDMEVVKTVNDVTPTLGDEITFTLNVRNYGPNTATNVKVTDVIPAGLTVVGSTPANVWNPSTGVWNIGTMAPNAVQRLQITVRVDAIGQITNTATIAADQPDPFAGNNSSAATINGSAYADLSLTKTASNLRPNLGDDVVFTVSIHNDGPNAATNVRVADPLPASLSLSSSSASRGAYVAGVWNVGTLQSGESAILQMTTRVLVPGTITNTAEVSSASPADPDSTPGNGANEDDRATVVLNAPEAADLALRKEVDLPQAGIGQKVKFIVSLSNNGPNTATNIRIEEAVAAGLRVEKVTPTVGSFDGTDWIVPSLDPGSTASIEVEATVTRTGLLTNRVQVLHADQFDPVSANNRASAAVTTAPVADVRIIKTADTLRPQVGNEVTFQVIVTNDGPDVASSVTVQDVLPSSLTFVAASTSAGTFSGSAWQVGRLAVGQSATLHLTARVNVSGQIVNLATVANIGERDVNPGNNAANITINATKAADLAVTKSVDNTTPTVGSNVVFTVRVTNNGPDTATNIRITDLLPEGLRYVSAVPSAGTFDSRNWSFASLPLGASATLQITTEVTRTGFLNNTAFVSASDIFDPILANNEATASINAAKAADLAIQKTVSKLNPTPNETITYTVEVTNNGPDNAGGVAVTDLLPSGLDLVTTSPARGAFTNGVWNIGTVAKGEKVILTIAAQVRASGAIVNTASISASDVFDPISANNTSSATVNSPIGADLALTKSANTATPSIGGNVVFTITLTNNGPRSASGIIVDDLLPADLTFVDATVTGGSFNGARWSVPSLAVGASQSLTLTAKVNNSGFIRNTATISAANEFDPITANNTAFVVVNAALGADLAITKTVNKLNPSANEVITFTLNVSNNGPNRADNITVKDVLPSGLEFVSASASQGNFAGDTWSIATLGLGQQVALQIAARVRSSGAISNTATITGASLPDPVVVNNTSTATINAAGAQADLSVSKTVDNLSKGLGETAAFTIALSNAGPDVATGVKLTDTLPNGLTLRVASATRGTFVNGVWNVGTVAVGETVLLKIDAEITANGTITNTATITAADQADPVAANNTSSATLNSGAAADLSVVKTVDNLLPKVGDRIIYKV